MERIIEVTAVFSFKVNGPMTPEEMKGFYLNKVEATLMSGLTVDRTEVDAELVGLETINVQDVSDDNDDESMDDTFDYYDF